MRDAFIRRRGAAAIVVATLSFGLVAAGGTAIGGPEAVSHKISKKKTKKIAKKYAKKYAKQYVQKYFPVSNEDIADGAVSSEKLGQVFVRSVNTSIPPGNTGSATATCLPGERVMGGGFETGLALDRSLAVQVNRLSDLGDGWTVGGLAMGDEVPLTVEAYCLD